MKDKLHIAMLSIHSCPLSKLGGRDTGGMNVYIRELSRELSKCGHSVDIYTRSHQSQHCDETCLAENVRLIHLDNNVDDDLFKLTFPQYYKLLSQNLNDYKNKNHLDYDLIHSHYWQSGMVGNQLQKWWQLPHITMFHTLGAIKRNLGMSTGDPPSRIEGEIQIAETSNRIIASTEKEKDYLEQFYKATGWKIDIIPCGVNLDLFRPLGQLQSRQILGLGNEKFILFVGRLEPLKGIDQLLIAFSQVKNKLPVKLMVIGGDDDTSQNSSRIKAMAAELNILDITYFGGPVTQKTLPLLYSASDICVIPSYYESFCLVALESLACGTPVITTDVGQMKNIINHPLNGRVLADNSSVLLAREIELMLSHITKNQEDIELRRNSIRKYDWSFIADQVLNSYNCLTVNPLAGAVETPV